MTRITRAASLVVVVAVLAVGAAVWSRRGAPAPPSPVVLENGKTHYGKTYAEWGSAWWRWLYEAPQRGARCTMPDDDATGANCAYGQTDPDVFFLAGTRGGKVVRTRCVVPRNRALFFPVVTYVTDNAGVVPEEIMTTDQMLAAATTTMDTAFGLSLIVDGTKVDMTKQRVAPTRFSYTMPAEPNYYTCAGAHGVTGLVDPAYSAGYWVMLAPLAPGPHEIAFGGTVPRSTGALTVDVVYRLRVE